MPLSNTDPNLGMEPNFNLNLNLTSPSNPRPPTETSKLPGGVRKDDGRKGGGKTGTQVCVTSEPGKWRNTVKTEGGERLKSPNPKLTASPEPQQKEQTTITSLPGTTERVQPQTAKNQSASTLNPKPHSDITKSTNKSAANHKMPSNRKGEARQTTAPKVHAHKETTTPAAKTPKPASVNTTVKAEEAVSHDSSLQSFDISVKLINQRPDATLQNSPSLNPSEKQRTGESEENLQSKDSNAGFTSKTSSTSKATTASKDSLDFQHGTDSTAHPSSKSTMGSRDSLDSKSGSASKSSLGSKDSLDSKTGPSSRASSDSKHGTGSRESLDSKTAKTKADKALGVSKSRVSRGRPDHKTSSAVFNIKPSQVFKPGSNLSSSSDVLSDSKCNSTQLTSEPVEPARSSSDLSGCDDSILEATGSSATPSPDPGEPDSCMSGPVQSSSKPSLADLSSSLGLSPRPGSASRSPGSGPVKSLGCIPSGPSKEGLRSPGSAPASRVTPGRLAPPPEPAAAVAVETHSSNTSHKTGLTRGLTFDSITKTPAAVEKEHLKLPETEVSAVGLEVSVQGVGVCEKAAGSPGDGRRGTGSSWRKLGPQRDVNAITTASNVPLPRKKEEKKKKQEKGKQGDGLGSSSRPLRPRPHSTSSKRVRETTAVTDPSQRLRRREVGVQVEVHMVERSASTSPSLHLEDPSFPTIGSPGCQSGGPTLPAVPSLSWVPPGQPPVQHVCTIDIELRSQSALPSVDKASSLPACLRTYSYQPSPGLLSDPGPGQDQKREVSTESIWEDEQEQRDAGEVKEPKKVEEQVKPKEVARDEQGMTWEVYGAMVDPESLGTAIQTHLESKIQQQEKRIRALRKCMCSDSSLKAFRTKKRRKRRGGIMGCCRKAPAGSD